MSEEKEQGAENANGYGEPSREINAERDRVVRLLSLAAMLMPTGDLYYVDLIKALKACVRNPDLHLDYSIECERAIGRARRGY